MVTRPFSERSWELETRIHSLPTAVSGRRPDVNGGEAGQGGLRPPRGHPEATLRPSGGQPVGTPRPPGGHPEAYSSPRVIHRSEESPQGLLPAASVNNSAAREKSLGMNGHTLSPDRENTHRPATNTEASHSMTQGSPSSRATRWSLTNTQWRTASLSRSLYKPFAQDQPARF
jgi:hypothetical protein